MGITLMGLLTENNNRIITGKSTGSLNLTAVSFIKQGYKPYKIIDGKIIPQQIPFKSDMDYNEKNQDNTIYFLSDDEFNEGKKLEEKMTDLIKLYQEKIKLLQKYVPGYIQAILNKTTTT